jgi:hypothetical protein
MEAGSATDLEDTVPPSTVVGQALRLSDGTPGSVALAWPAAATPPAGEEWVVLRSDGAPGGPFAAAASGVGPAWTDGDAARTGPRPHCWFYDVRVEDSCLNVSPD